MLQLSAYWGCFTSYKIIMKEYKFVNKKQGTAYTTISILLVIVMVVLFSSLDININKYFIFFLASLISFISTFFLIKQASKNFEEIQFNDELVSVRFFNRMKKVQSLKRKETKVKIEDKKIILLNTGSNEIIGIAHKEMMDDPSKWEELTNAFS
jgi:uncharacterized membrane protein